MSHFRLRSRDYLDQPARKLWFNRQLFSAIASEYGKMSRVLSFGRDQVWKRRLVSELPDMIAPNCLDLACGDGDLGVLLMARYVDARLIALDLSEPMLALARQRLAGDQRVRFINRDMTATGLSASSFDRIVVGYGLRNAPDLDLVLAEIKRLLKPGGIVAVLDFSRWNHPCLAALQITILRGWCGLWGLLRSGNPDTYGYIADSLSRFPNRRQLQEKFALQGLGIAREHRYFLGTIQTFMMVNEK